MNFDSIDLDEQNKLLNIAKAAEEEYYIDQDKEKLIKAYESVLCRKSPLKSNSRARKLALLYIETCREKEAVRFLNLCVRYQLMPLGAVRTIQADMSKKRGEYLRAVEFYLVASLAEEHGAVYHDFSYFKKRIRPCAKRLKWGEQEIEYLAYLLKSHVDQNIFSEIELIDSYRRFLKEKGIEY